MNPPNPTMSRQKYPLRHRRSIESRAADSGYEDDYSRLNRLVGRVQIHELSWFGGIFGVVVLVFLGLFLSGLLLGNLHNAALRVGFGAGGIALPLLVVRRFGDHAMLLALLWMFAASVLASLPWPGEGAALLAIPPSLWLLAELADRRWLANSWQRRLHMLAHVGWIMAVLYLGGAFDWMVIFAAGVCALFVVRFRPGLAVAVASTMALMVTMALHRQARLNLDSLLPLLRDRPCCVPRSWLMISQAGWFGGGHGFSPGWTAAPDVAYHWGWVGLMGIALLVAALLTGTVTLARRVSKWSFYTLITPLAAMIGTHLILHLLFIVGCPVGIFSLPMIGPGPECFVYSAILTLLALDRRARFYDDLAPLMRERRRRRRRLPSDRLR